MMKRCVILALAALLVLTFAACASAPPEPAPTETVLPEEGEAGLDAQDVPEQDTAENGEDARPQVQSFTLEQIQAALQGQFLVGDFGEAPPQVVSAQRVARNRDYIYLEGAGPDAPPIDLTAAFLYRVEIRFRQALEDYEIWAATFHEADFNPFRRDGDYTILTDYYYFEDQNGGPVLAFVSC